MRIQRRSRAKKVMRPARTPTKPICFARISSLSCAAISNAAQHVNNRHKILKEKKKKVMRPHLQRSALLALLVQQGLDLSSGAEGADGRDEDRAGTFCDLWQALRPADTSTSSRRGPTTGKGTSTGTHTGTGSCTSTVRQGHDDHTHTQCKVDLSAGEHEGTLLVLLHRNGLSRQRRFVHGEPFRASALTPPTRPNRQRVR